MIFRSLFKGIIDETLNTLDQEDPILVEYLKKKIEAPSPKEEKYYLQGDINMGEQTGQYGQVRDLVRKIIYKYIKRKLCYFFE